MKMVPLHCGDGENQKANIQSGCPRQANNRWDTGMHLLCHHVPKITVSRPLLG